jgi:tetratricopeptide (TPR) repeat protein
MANIRAAWSWALKHARLPEIRRSFEGIFWLLEVQGSQNREKGALLAQAVDLLRGARPTKENQLALGLALCCLALSLARTGPREAATAFAQEGLSLLCRLGPGRELALGHILAVLSGVAKDETQAKPLLEQGLAIAQEADGPLEACWALYLLGRVALSHSRYDEAEGHFLALLKIVREIDHRRGEARSLRGLGRMAQFRGQYARARAFFEQELAILRDLEVRANTLTCLNNLGEVSLASGDLEQAVARYREALLSSEELAVQEEMARALCGLGAVALATGDLSAARRRHRRALQVALEDKSVDTSRLTLVSVAKLCRHVGERELAVEVVALTLHVRPSFWREKVYDASALLEELRSDLSSDAYHAARARGRARDLEVTVKELLAELSE